MSFAIFNEDFYRTSYPDVKAGIESGKIKSGRKHFEEHGLKEGRVLVSPFYDEQAYLRKYPDVAAQVAAGRLPSGLAHYIQFGEAEGRSGTFFREDIYLLAYPDVADAVKAGRLNSGLEHFTKFGQFETRAAFFTGTNGNDNITAYGQVSMIVGVDPITTPSMNVGAGQIDTLTGGTGVDIFVIGDYYLGGGSNDYAVIRNFNRLNIDMIGVSGIPRNYKFDVVNGNTNISTTSGDLVAVVEGVTNLTVLSSDSSILNPVFIVG
jgi:Ca2+-binding RTX toxin-like protein